MSNMRRTKRLVALAAGMSLVLVAAACGDDDDDDAGGTATTGAAPGTTGAPGDHRCTRDHRCTGDHRCTRVHGTRRHGRHAAVRRNGHDDHHRHQPRGGVGGRRRPSRGRTSSARGRRTSTRLASLDTTGWDKITTVEAGESDQQVVVSLNEVFAPYKLLFDGLIKKAAVADCNDISAEFSTELPISGRPYRIDSWSESQLILVPNENYWGDDAPVASEVVMVPVRGPGDRDRRVAVRRGGLHLPAVHRHVGRLVRGPGRHRARHRARLRLRGLLLPVQRGPVRRSGLPRGVRHVDRPRRRVPADLRADLRVRPASRAACSSAARSCRARSASTRSTDNTYDPQGAEALLDRRRLGEGRARASGPRTGRRRRSGG